MAGQLTTHVLDTANGRPAAGIHIELHSLDDGHRTKLGEAVTNGDGRTDRPLLEGPELTAGLYELTFHIGSYFGSAPGFLDSVPVRFRITDANAHYHVPLLCSPWAYSTYRGS